MNRKMLIAAGAAGLLTATVAIAQSTMPSTDADQPPPAQPAPYSSDQTANPALSPSTTTMTPSGPVTTPGATSNTPGGYTPGYAPPASGYTPGVATTTTPSSTYGGYGYTTIGPEAPTTQAGEAPTTQAGERG
jgi:hypothetical protein